jgi:hypothetical protein
MNIYVGKRLARCGYCEGLDWQLVEAAATFSLMSELICASCGTEEIYADILLRSPADDTPAFV